MPRFALFAALLLTFTTLALLAPPARSYVPDDYTPVGPGDVYLALGDSIPAGYEVEANADGEPGYPTPLYNTLLEDYPDLQLTNLSIDTGLTSSGMITSTGESLLDQAVAFIESERAAGRRVGLITLTIGGNDMLSVLPEAIGGESNDPDEVALVLEANYDIIIPRLLEALTVEGERQGDLLIMNYYNPYPGLANPLDPDLTTDNWLPVYNQIIENAAVKYGIPMAEVAAAFEGNEADLIYVKRPYPPFFPQPDPADFDFHPRPAGHQVIAEEYLKVSGYGETQSITETVYLPIIQR
jgi:lysophospholipase L1-like esterase